MDRHDASSVRTGSLGRGLDALSLESIAKSDEVQAVRFQESLGEYEEQFQVNIAVQATNELGWVDCELPFRIPFLPATEMRDSPLLVPQFSYGFELLSGKPVMLTAIVTSWVRDVGSGSGAGSFGAVTGARVSVGVVRPGSDATVEKASFAAHLTFQGFGAPYDDAEDGQSDNVEVR